MLRPSFAPLALVALLVSASPARAVRDPGTPAAEAAGRSRPASLDPARQAALHRSPEWTAFRARHGNWRAQWNERAGTPHLATGPAIRLGGTPQDGPAVDRAVRAFIAGNPEV